MGAICSLEVRVMYLVFGKSKNKPPHLSIRSMPFRESSPIRPICLITGRTAALSSPQNLLA